MDKRKVADILILSGFILIVIGLSQMFKNQDKAKELKVIKANVTPTVVLTGEVNINTASLAQLDSLSGIGPVIGQRIIDYREAKGGFKSINEIKMVSGIGEKMFEKIKDKIKI